MGDLLGAASDLRASKKDYTKELEAVEYSISLARTKVCPLLLLTLRVRPVLPWETAGRCWWL